MASTSLSRDGGENSDSVELFYSRRRWMYSFGVTAFCLCLDAYLVIRMYEGPVATMFVKESLSLIGSIALYYLCVGAIDRSRVLDRIGDKFAAGAAPPTGYQSKVTREETVTVDETPKKE